ncbi:hypothetical protein ABZ345_32495 [Lentzea sp. NPDC005914]|uniref:hypothetical protein n=1 Tax=Lentzea sp. NPDC005914 TaxID=3154572 RepID=UPI0034070753
MFERPVRSTLLAAMLVMVSLITLTGGAQAARGVTAISDVTAFARDIDWGSFPDLPEDRIALSESPGVVPGDSIRLVLESAPNITWWKAIDAHAWDGSNIGWVETKNANHGPNGMTVRLDDVSDIVLAKAGFLGVYKGMYRLSNEQLRQKAGSQVTFRWQRD